MLCVRHGLCLHSFIPMASHDCASYTKPGSYWDGVRCLGDCGLSLNELCCKKGFEGCWYCKPGFDASQLGGCATELCGCWICILCKISMEDSLLVYGRVCHAARNITAV